GRNRRHLALSTLEGGKHFAQAGKEFLQPWEGRLLLIDNLDRRVSDHDGGTVLQSLPRLAGLRDLLRIDRLTAFDKRLNRVGRVVHLVARFVHGLFRCARDALLHLLVDSGCNFRGNRRTRGLHGRRLRPHYLGWPIGTAGKRSRLRGLLKRRGWRRRGGG